ncbi:MAG: PqqD family protein [bacterium]|nr:PqqD family protein [bacterium]
MKRYSVNPVVSLRPEPDGGLLYNPDTDEVVLINETGRLIWDFIRSSRTPDEIAAFIEQETTGAENAAADAESFLESLLPDFVIAHDEPAAS